MATNCVVRPVSGYIFEDILDGYFPLEESVRQMMERHAFTSMWITLLHAPVMNLPDLPPTAPVPLYLPKIYSGMIEKMVISADQEPSGLQMRGIGEWFFVDGREDSKSFPASIRLGEPAFVRGVGIRDPIASEDKTPSGGSLALAHVDASVPVTEGLREATGRLGWSASRAWGIGKHCSGIGRANPADGDRAFLGEEIHVRTNVAGEPSGTALPLPDSDRFVLVDISPDRKDRDSLDLARRL